MKEVYFTGIKVPLDGVTCEYDRIDVEFEVGNEGFVISFTPNDLAEIRKAVALCDKVLGNQEEEG